MTDSLTSNKRAALMARVRHKNTAPEMALRKNLHRMGLRFRLHAKHLPGTPDLIFPKYRTAVFVHGCFWHRHLGCKQTTTPKTNAEFWRAKFDQNMERDRRVEQQIRSLGWRVYVVWECELDTISKAEKTSDALAIQIRRSAAVPS